MFLKITSQLFIGFECHTHTQNDSQTVNTKKREGDTSSLIMMMMIRCGSIIVKWKGIDEQDKRETCVIQATASSTTHYLDDDDDDVIGSLLDVKRFRFTSYLPS